MLEGRNSSGGTMLPLLCYWILASKERASEKRCKSVADLNTESLDLENLVKVSGL